VLATERPEAIGVVVLSLSSFRTIVPLPAIEALTSVVDVIAPATRARDTFTEALTVVDAVRDTTTVSSVVALVPAAQVAPALITEVDFAASTVPAKAAALTVIVTVARAVVE
jgi:hypothetical protein